MSQTEQDISDIQVSRCLDVTWDSEKHEVIIMGRRFRPCAEDEQDRADDAKEVFYGITDMNRRVIEVEDLLDNLRSFTSYFVRTAERQLLIDAIRERDTVKAELARMKAEKP